ncbi:MAG: peptidase [Coxiella sp. DG_40]|nr:MAG: peptidase [Coxiella sp. DG_40]
MKGVDSFFRNIVLGLLSITLTLMVIGGVILFFIIFQLPNIDQLKDVHLQIPLRVYTSDGMLIGEFGEKRRTPVTLNQIPKQLIRAVIDTEDQRFYEHPGVDFIGLARATKALFLTGKKIQGASTITMQVARDFFLSPKKTYYRKFKEMLLAIKIDHEFSKDDILQLYLNKVYFGQSAYGVAAASQVYYGESLDQLTLPQIAVIAGLPQAPTRNNPLTNPENALERRNHVLKRMLEEDDLDQTTYQQAIQAPLTAKYHVVKPIVNAPYVAEMARIVMYTRLGDAVYDQGLKVYTTIDSHLQEIANQAIRDNLVAYSKRHGFIGPEQNLGSSVNVAEWQKKLQQMPTINDLVPAAITNVKDQSVIALLANGTSITIEWPNLSWAQRRLAEGSLGSKPNTASDILKIGDVIRAEYSDNGWQMAQLPQINGALVSVNPSDGAVLALVGGFSYQQDKFNCAIQADRQAGSSFKPFVYSAALAKGFTLASIINDAPIVMSDSGENSLWRPENVTKSFYGPTLLRTGLIKSRNLVSIRLLQAIGIPYAINYLQRFGFDPQNLPTTLSLALGTATVSPIDLTAAYAVFANGGYKVKPFFIDHVTDEDGKVIYQAQLETVAPDGGASRVITQENAYLITDAMKDVIRHGTGRRALKLKRSDLAGKTGTTNQQLDAWFVGFNGNMVTTIWMGFDQPQSLYEYGAQAALPVWIDFMQQALQGTPESILPRPSDIVTVRIDPKTGLLAYPGQRDAIFELFQKQNVPNESADSSNQNGNENKQVNNNDEDESQQIFN